MRSLDAVSWVHTLGILRGAAENNDTKYLSALGGYNAHVAPLIAAGFAVRLADDELPELESFVLPTEAGQAFYNRYLSGLPASTSCRANAWTSMPQMQEALAAIEAECRSRINLR